MDVLERCLYNSFLSGVSLTGERFFYPNKLCSVNGNARSEWFPCACCPPNVVRFIPQVPAFFYASKPGELFVNLYGSSTAEPQVDGGAVSLKATSAYPWDGQVRLEVNPTQTRAFTLRLRIPGWLEKPLPSDLYRYAEAGKTSATLKVNGQVVPVQTVMGYASIRRKWQSGDVVELELPMPARLVLANDKVITRLYP